MVVWIEGFELGRFGVEGLKRTGRILPRMEAAENDYRIVRRKTWRDSHDGTYRVTRFAQQNPFSGSYHAWQDLRAMHDLRGLCSEKGPSLARYSPGVFPNGDLQGILNTWRAYLAKTSSFWMHGGDILPGRGVFTVRGSFGNTSGRYFARMRPFVCPKCASRVLHSEGAPSSVRNESRKRFVSALQGFGVRCRSPGAPRCGLWRRRCRSPRRPRVAGVGGGSTDRTEAEPFAAKRSETG